MTDQENGGVADPSLRSGYPDFESRINQQRRALGSGVPGSVRAFVGFCLVAIVIMVGQVYRSGPLPVLPMSPFSYNDRGPVDPQFFKIGSNSIGALTTISDGGGTLSVTNASAFVYQCIEGCAGSASAIADDVASVGTLIAVGP